MPGAGPHHRYLVKDVDTFAGFDEAAGRKILGENAINFYGMDRDYLNTLGAEFGPSSSIFNG